MTRRITALRRSSDPAQEDRAQFAEIGHFEAAAEQALKAEMNEILDQLSPENQEALLRIARAMVGARQG